MLSSVMYTAGYYHQLLFPKRDWSTSTADSSPSDTTFLITANLLSSQQAFKIRLLTQTPTKSLGTSAHCEQQDPGVPLICIWCQDEIQMGCESASMSRLQWEENQILQMRFRQPTDREDWDQDLRACQDLAWSVLCTQVLLPRSTGCSAACQEQF